MSQSSLPPPDTVFRAMVDTFLAGDEEAFARFFHPEVVWYGTLVGTDVVGLSALRGVFRAFRSVAKPTGLRSFRTFGSGTALALYGAFEVEAGQMEVVQVLRLDAQGRVVRGHSILDPRPLLLPGWSREPGPDAPYVACIQAFFQAFRKGDLAELMAMAVPGIEYFGSRLETPQVGLEAAVNQFTAARTQLGIATLTPLRLIGMGVQVGVITAFEGPGGSPRQEGVLHFRFDDELRITHFSAIWDVPAFLRPS